MEVNIYIYWILDLEDEVHSIWDLWIIGLQECKANDFFKVGCDGHKFLVGSRISQFLYGVLPLARIYLPQKAHRGRFTVRLPKMCHSIKQGSLTVVLLSRFLGYATVVGRSRFAYFLFNFKKFLNGDGEWG
jgi:hypothetical protein